MEDSSRDLEKELKKYDTPNPFKRTGQWQMLLISDDGKMVSIKRYKDLAVIVITLLVISLLSTALLSVLYIRSFNANRTLKNDFVTAEQERKELQDENERLNAQLFMTKKREGKEVKDAAPKKEEEAKVESPPPVKKVVKKVEKMKAAVKDLTMTKDATLNETHIRFIVKNDCELDSIAGRVFVVLKPDSDKPQDWLTMPPVTLKDGVPSMPSRGQFFSINNFKSVNFKFNNPMPDDHYKTMAIYIYSNEGDLIFEDTFKIELIVVNKPAPKPEKKDTENVTDSAAAPSKPASTSAAEESETRSPEAMSSDESGEEEVPVDEL